MNTANLLRLGKLIVILILLAPLAANWNAHGQPQAPPEEVQTISFSVSPGSPLVSLGAHPADILGIGDVPLIQCANLGLICTDLDTGAQDDITGLSYGVDFSPVGTPMLLFSPSPGASGLSGTALRAESQCQPAESASDVFESPLDGTNVQYMDGDGAPCSTNSGYSLYLQELPTSDNLDALDGDPCQVVDLDCDGLPEGPIFLTLAPGSPTLAYLGLTAADVLMVTGYTPPSLWASGATDFGLQNGDAIDALCILENGNGVYDPEDQVLLSLAPGSPTLSLLSASPGDLLRPRPRWARIHASLLGLAAPGDDLDAAYCNRQLDIYDNMLPFLRR